MGKWQVKVFWGTGGNKDLSLIIVKFAISGVHIIMTRDGLEKGNPRTNAIEMLS